MPRICASLSVALLLTAGLLAAPSQSGSFLPIEDVKPGMIGVGRTVFEGDAIEEFRVHIIGVLRNVIGPRRDLILAKLEGGPLATTGVIQGMSGSPVYIDGRLVGAVSYALGLFPREPIAGITPIGEMISAVDEGGPRQSKPPAAEWPAQPAEVFARLSRLAERAAAPLGPVSDQFRINGPATLADLAPALRPIGAAMVMGGFDPSIDRDLRQALSVGQSDAQPSGRTPRTPDPTSVLRPGDSVGMSLIRGDLEMGATGTVTHVSGNRVYAFGHPFLNLGPTSYAMTRSRVFTVLPSLASSMKIATLGPVIGTVQQDRSTAIGGTLGPPPREMEVDITLTSDRAPERRFKFYVIHDQLLTPLFTYVAVLNSLVSYERQAGAMSIAASGVARFGDSGEIAIDDFFTGDSAVTAAATGVAGPVGAAISNEFRPVMPEKLELRLRVSERQESTSIERVWLDTTRPRFGGTHTLQVLLRDYRGTAETISIPITMPVQASGPLTLLVSDAATLMGLEQRELKPGKPSTWPALMKHLNTSRRNNHLYVSLISSSAGTSVGGETLPALPSSVRSILDDDKTIASLPITRTIVGSWEHRLQRAVKGSRELTVTLTSRQ